MPSQVVEHPLPSQVSLGLQPAVLVLVAIGCLPAEIVIVIVELQVLRPTVVVREPSFHHCFLGRLFGRSTLQLMLLGLLLVRLQRLLRLLLHVRVVVLLFRAWLLPVRGVEFAQPIRRPNVFLNCWNFGLLLWFLEKLEPAAPLLRALLVSFVPASLLGAQLRRFPK